MLSFDSSCPLLCKAAKVLPEPQEQGPMIGRCSSTLIHIILQRYNAVLQHESFDPDLSLFRIFA